MYGSSLCSLCVKSASYDSDLGLNELYVVVRELRGMLGVPPVSGQKEVEDREWEKRESKLESKLGDHFTVEAVCLVVLALATAHSSLCYIQQQ